MAIRGNVYMMGNSAMSMYKVGCSIDPDRRFKSVQRKCPFPIELLYILPTKDQERAERWVHRELHDRKLCYEWFALTEQDFQRLYALGYRIIKHDEWERKEQCQN